MGAIVLGAEEEPEGLHHLTRSGADLYFYFINVDVKTGRRSGRLEPLDRDPNKPSYFIVQLPPQSLHEQYYYSSAKPPKDAPDGPLQALLAGPSFLAFELWPDWKKKRLKRRMPFTVEALMDWENQERFHLLTIDDTLHQVDKYWPLIKQKDDFEKQHHLHIKPGDALGSNNFYTLGYYQFLVKQCLNQQTDRLLTIFELPAGIITAPINGARDGSVTADICWTPVVRQNGAKPDGETISEACYSFSRNGGKFTREVRERWNAEIEYVPRVLMPKGKTLANGAPASSIAASLAALPSLPPALRIIGLLDRGGLTMPVANLDPNSLKPFQLPDGSAGYLPTLLDQVELLYLTQLGKDKLRGSRFDVKVESPFLLTSLGASTKFHYKNYNTVGLGDTSLSLVEYEHHFQDGRDNYIKVSRIGAMTPDGHRLLHVMVARRKIEAGRSFLEYKEYIEFLEPEKRYGDPLVNMDGTPTPYDNFVVQGGNGEEDWQSTYQRGRALPYSSAKVGWTRTPNMKPVGPGQAVFWVEHEVRAGGPQEGSYANLIQVPIHYTDQNGSEIPKVSFHPILFMARGFFANPTGVNPRPPNGKDWVDGKDLTSLQKNYDQRVRIPFNGQVVAFTPDHVEKPARKPDGMLDESKPPPRVPNKANHLATEWCEYMINVAQPLPVGSADSIFDVATHPIYPRMRRAKAFLDHLQQYGGKKLPSIVTFHPEYLTGQSDIVLTANAPAAITSTSANTASVPAPPIPSVTKFVLTHTDDYMAGHLRDLDHNEIVGSLLDTDLAGGWDNIQKTFGAAGKELGGIINPDPQLKNVSLSTSALSLPDSLTDLSKIDPQAIFKGMNAELFCGIRLKDILALLDLDNLPQYLLSKLPGDFADPQKALEAIKGNDIIQEVLNDIQTTKETIDRLKGEVEKARQVLARVQGQLDQLRASLKDQLQVFDKLEGVAVLEFRAVLAEFTALREIAVRPLLMVVETVKTLQDIGLQNQVAQQKSLVEFLLAVRDLLGKPDFKKSWAGLEFAADFEALRMDLDNTAGELRTCAAKVEFLFSGDWVTHPETFVTDLTTLLTDDLQQIVAEKGTVADRFFHRMAQLTKLFELVKDRLPDAEREVWEMGLRQIDLLRRLSTDFYTQEKTRLEEERDDILRTANLAIAKEQDCLTALMRRGTEFAQHLLDLCQGLAPISSTAGLGPASAIITTTGTIDAGNIIKAIKFASDPAQVKQFFQYELDVFKAELIAAAQNSPAYRELAAKLTELKELGVELNGAKKAWTDAEQELVRRVQSEADDLLGELEQKFNERVAELTDAEEVKRARAAYDQLIQLMTCLKRQELSLNWQTENFRSVDLGFVRFDQSTSPNTRLEMKVHAVMEMDPFKFPPVVQSTEVKTETRLTDFSIMFFDVIGVRFARVAFVAGTKSTTDLDVRISDVTFGGGMSFIQLLQSLLQGLSKGMRLEVKADAVEIGFQTPSLDISSPGFTFSNFSVGMRLLINFSHKPLQLTFLLAEAAKKATIAAGIYGGCFYCAMTMEPKRGLVAIEMALEMGAYVGISFGPFSGHVKFMVGLFYKKDDTGLTLEGYLIAEGVLSVWIISLSARLYMGVRSQSNSVEGFCVASVEVSIGFFSKTFTASYTKRVAGAASNTPAPSASVAALRDRSVAGANRRRVGPGSVGLTGETGQAGGKQDDGVDLVDLFIDEDRAMSLSEFEYFAKTFFSAAI